MSKLPGIIRFEIRYQIRRPWPWLAFAVLVVFTFLTTRTGIVPVTLPEDFVLNSPFIITAVSVLACQIWLLVGAAVAGEAAARDVQSGMHPLMYTSGVSKAEYVFGRFIAAFILNTLVLLGVQIGSLLAAYAPGIAPEIIGPFRPTAYLKAYVLIGLSNALIATAVQFMIALFSGRAIASYAGSMLLFFVSYPLTVLLFLSRLGKLGLWRMTDAIGVFVIMNEMMSNWTIAEKNVRAFVLEGAMLWNRLLWIAIALTVLAVAYARFRFRHRVPSAIRVKWVKRVFRQRSEVTGAGAPHLIPIPFVQQSFGLAAWVRQAIAIAASSFRMIAKSPAGLFFLVVFPMFVALVVRVESEHWGVQLLPRTGYVLTKHVMASLQFLSDYRVVVPLMMVYFVGELVWRERDMRIDETIDATPVAEWTVLIGKYLGIALVLVALMTMLTIAVMVAQTTMGYHGYETGLSLKLLLGLQLPEYLLFAVLVFAIQAVVNQKHAGMLASLAAYFLIVFSSLLRIHHNLLVFGASPAWSYTRMRGLGASVTPWLWFKLYWAAWAVILAVVARLLWVRGREEGWSARMQLIRSRFNRRTVAATAFAGTLVVALGGFIFYNTNVLNKYRSDAEVKKEQAEYERRYGKYENIPQPHPQATKLRIEIYPSRGTATLTGSYRLVNRDKVAIDSIHIERASFVDTRLTFDRRASLVSDDTSLNHSIYALDQPLAPGDSITLSFEVTFAPRGFRNSGVARAVTSNASYLTGAALPAIGYQSSRELTSADDRRAENLPRQITLPTPDDVDPSVAARSPALFEAVIGTDADQVAVAPGELKRTWTQGARRYFQYASDIPLSGLYTFFSAPYVVQRERWSGVDVQFYTVPEDTAILERMKRGARASLEYYSREFSPYPYRFLQVIEQPSNGLGMGVDGSGVITGLEGTYLLNPRGERLDAVFEIVAHEMGHQWWGVQLKYAFAEGAILLSESLAWYSGMQVVKNTMGRERLRQFMSYLREPYPWPPMRTGLPLLRAMDPYAGYRKGPFAFYALSEYIGEDRLNSALRNLLAKKGVGSSALATTRDLYAEMQAVTPDSMKPLLHDLFETNTYWTFNTKKATAREIAGGKWEVTLDVEARKEGTDSAGVATPLEMHEPVEIGIFAPAKEGQILGEVLYLEKVRVKSGRQAITIVVASKPDRAGIDPYNLLDWEEGDNIEGIALEEPPGKK